MAVCSDCWLKFREALGFEGDDLRAGLSQTLAGGLVGFIAVKLFKYVIMCLGMLIVGLDLAQRQQIVGNDYEYLFDEMGSLMLRVSAVAYEILWAKSNRSFMAGLLVGSSSCLK